MRIVMTAALVAVLSGCATEANYNARLSRMVGVTETYLISQWGPPSSVYENGGTRFLTYARGGSTFVPGVAPMYQTTVIGRTAITQPVGGSPSMLIQQNCATTFTISPPPDQRVTNWRWEGNDCKSRE